MAPTETGDAQRVDLRWLHEPRWGAVAAYGLALALSRLHVLQPMPWLPIALGAAITVASNMALATLRRDGSAPLTLAILLLDMVVLTGVLYTSGGAGNPLTALYLIPIALAAMLLPASWAWSVTALSITAFGILFFADDPASAGGVVEAAGGAVNPHAGHAGHAGHAAAPGSDGHFSSHLRGMWVAYTLTAVSVAYFITRVAAALREREKQLVRVRTRVLRAERVAALASLAGSTAHELGTPLATIRLVASEMERAIERGADASDLVQDARLVGDQATRCREILDAMLGDAGETVGEAPVPVSVRAIVDDALALVPASERERLQVTLAEPLPTLRLPRKSVAQSLHNLLRNALDASLNDTPVSLHVDTHEDLVRFLVEDRGVGMSAEALHEAVEPFVTSKPRGQGLGLFLARTVAERLGGQLVLTSTPGQGTRAQLEICRDWLEQGT